MGLLTLATIYPIGFEKQSMLVLVLADGDGEPL